MVTALLRGGANLNVDNVCRSTPIEAAKSKLRMMRMHSPDRDMEGADELFEVRRPFPLPRCRWRDTLSNRDAWTL